MSAVAETDAVVADEYEALIQFLYMAPIGLLQARLDGELVMVNPLCAQLLMPLSRDGCMTNLYEALETVAPDLRSRVDAFELQYGMVCEGWHLRVPAGAGTRPVAQFLSLTLLKLDGQRLMAVIGDVTENLRRERELRQNQAWINTLVEGLTDYALVTLDHQGRIRDWNRSLRRLVGREAADSVGTSYRTFYPPDGIDDTGVLDRLHEADQSGWSLEEGWRVRADGSRFWASCLIAPLEAACEVAPEDRAYSLVMRDMSDRRDATERLRRAVASDHLTGLANRRTFHEACEREIARWQRQARPLSLLLIDADRFKLVNDRFGHAAGDAVLRHLAAALAAASREMDVVARLGGEEFVVLLRGCDGEQAALVAQRLCDGIAARTLTVEGVTLACTVSIGVASMDAALADVDGLVRRADVAMYAAKAAGRNCVRCWQPGLQVAAPAAPAAPAPLTAA